MNELDELKALWKKQDYEENEVFGVDGNLGQKIEKQRTRIRRANILASVCMIVTSIYLLSLMFTYTEEMFLFYFTISLVIALMGIMVIVLWKRSLLGVDQLAMDNQSYVRYQLKRLKRNKLVIQYSPLYGLVLGVLINAYVYSLLGYASVVFVYWMTNINWFYTFVVSYFSYMYEMKKFKKNVEPLIDDLENLNENMNARLN